MSKASTFKSGKQVSENFYEVTRNQSTITEKYPIHCGTTILHLSKLILLNFVKFLDDFLIRDSFEIVYSDTDSMCLVLEDEMENLVKPEKISEWSNASGEWFVKNHNDAWDLRRPGKMKLEWSSHDGGIVW